jgi:dihydroxyacetone kinase
MTALDMPGCSLTLLPVDDRRLALLDAESGAPAWPGDGRIQPRKLVPAVRPAQAASNFAEGRLAPVLRSTALAVAAALEGAEADLAELDSRAGDGDLGASMVRGAGAIRGLPEAAWGRPDEAFVALGGVLRRAIAGSSGPFYAVALLRAARDLTSEAPDGTAWSRAFSAAVASIGELGGAKVGDRTMLDALQPAADAFSGSVERGSGLADAWREAVLAAEAGAASTINMKPRLGRAAYLGDRALGAPDAGASAVLIWMRAIRDMQ